jgi:hypothetical protein
MFHLKYNPKIIRTLGYKIKSEVSKVGGDLPHVIGCQPVCDTQVIVILVAA